MTCPPLVNREISDLEDAKTDCNRAISLSSSAIRCCCCDVDCDVDNIDEEPTCSVLPTVDDDIADAPDDVPLTFLCMSLMARVTAEAVSGPTVMTLAEVAIWGPWSSFDSASAYEIAPSVSSTGCKNSSSVHTADVGPRACSVTALRSASVMSCFTSDTVFFLSDVVSAALLATDLM